jgi:hypothetical protein
MKGGGVLTLSKTSSKKKRVDFDAPPFVNAQSVDEGIYDRPVLKISSRHETGI